MEVVVLVCASLVLGLAVGILSGLLGIGGGTIMVPTFRLIYRMSALAATATSMLTIVPTAVSGMIAHIRNKTCVLPIGIAAGVGGACSSWLGVLFAEWSPDWCVMAATALVIAYSATTMLKKARALSPARTAEATEDAGRTAETSADTQHTSKAEAAPTEAAPTEKEHTAEVTTPSAAPALAAVTPASTPAETSAQQATSTHTLARAAVIGLFAGVLSGYVGVGGGFIMVPLFTSKLQLTMKQATGTSLVGVGLLVLPALIAQVVLGNVNWVAGLACIAGSVPGAALGAKLQTRIPERMLRFTFAGILGVAAVLLVVNELGVLS